MVGVRQGDERRAVAVNREAERRERAGRGRHGGGAAPVTAPSCSGTTSTVPGSGSAFNVTSRLRALIAPTWAVLPAGGVVPSASSSAVVPSIPQLTLTVIGSVASRGS